MSARPGRPGLSQAATEDPDLRALLEDTSLSNAEVGRRFGCSESVVRRWRDKHGVRPGTVRMNVSRPPGENEVADLSRFSGEDRRKLHQRLDAVLDEVLRGSTATVAGLTVRQWEGFQRGQDGTPQVVQLQGIKLDVKVSEETPLWPLIDRPAVTYKVPAPDAPRQRHPRDRIAIILPDPQIGFRQYEDGTLDPFHDEAAIDVAFQVAADLRPDRIVCLGDFQDFTEFGKYVQERSFARTTQRGIDRGYEFGVQMRAACPDGVLDVLEGNHDKRAEKRILESNAAAWGLRRAGDKTGWPVFSVPYLCAFDELGINYHGGYPAGELWLLPELRCIHGYKVRSSGSTAAAVVRDEGVSTIFGHVHRIETQYVSRRHHGGHKTLLAHTPGCLCRTDGAVPSVKSGTGPDGRPVPSAENWQQGLSVVEYREGKPGFHLHSVYIDTVNGHEARFGGRSYLPRRKSRK